MSGRDTSEVQLTGKKNQSSFKRNVRSWNFHFPFCRLTRYPKLALLHKSHVNFFTLAHPSFNALCHPRENPQIRSNPDAL